MLDRDWEYETRRLESEVYELKEKLKKQKEEMGQIKRDLERQEQTRRQEMHQRTYSNWKSSYDRNPNYRAKFDLSTIPTKIYNLSEAQQYWQRVVENRGKLLEGVNFASMNFYLEFYNRKMMEAQEFLSGQRRFYQGAYHEHPECLSQFDI
jgi:chromosome segregation ATPase